MGAGATCSWRNEDTRYFCSRSNGTRLANHAKELRTFNLAEGQIVSLSVIILATGAGKRMQSATPNVLHRVAGMPMIRYSIEAVTALEPAAVVVVVGADHQAVASAASPCTMVVQDPRKGTGHAVMSALPSLPASAEVLVVLGDSPLLTTQTLQRLLEARRAATAAVALLGFRAADPWPYARLICDANGEPLKCVEARDCTPEQLRIDLVSSSVMVFDGNLLRGLLAQLRPSNAQGEYYLTDMIQYARADQRRCIVVEGPEYEFLGVNSRLDLANVESEMQRRLRRRAMEFGVTLVDPASVWLCADTILGCDVLIEPNVVFEAGVRVADGVTIEAFSRVKPDPVRGYRIEFSRSPMPVVDSRPIPPKFDVFISYATEDHAYASELADALTAKGLLVWFAPVSLQAGDVILSSINRGLDYSRSGVVVLSKSFLAKKWTAYELGELERQNIERGKRLIPIWLDISREDLEAKHKGLGRFLAITTPRPIDSVASVILKALSADSPG